MTTAPSILEIDGRRIAYRDAGPRAAAPILLLHALASSSATWDVMAAAFAERGRRTIAVDLCGHGRSSRSTRYAMDDFRPDLVALLDHLGIARCDVVGHSLGGQVALRLAARSPERVGRLVLEEPALPRFDDAGTDAPAARPGWRGLSKLLGIVRLARVLLVNRFDRRVLRPVLGYVRAVDPEFAALAARVRAPTLVLSAATADSSRTYQRLAASLPDARHEALGDSHHLHREHPERFVALVDTFLAQADRVAGQHRAVGT